MDEQKDIVYKEEQLTDEDLLKYLLENMSEEEKYSFEKKVTGPFESDALDGLQQIKDKARLHKNVHQLHQKLPQLLLSRKQRLEKRKLKDFQWIIYTITILLILCIITFIMIIKTHH